MTATTRRPPTSAWLRQILATQRVRKKTFSLLSAPFSNVPVNSPDSGVMLVNSWLPSIWTRVAFLRRSRSNCGPWISIQPPDDSKKQL